MAAAAATNNATNNATNSVSNNVIIGDKPGKKRTLGELQQGMKVATDNTAASSFVPFHDVSTVQSLIDSKASKTDASISQQGRKVLKAKRKRTAKKDSKDSLSESPKASNAQIITK